MTVCKPIDPLLAEALERPLLEAQRREIDARFARLVCRLEIEKLSRKKHTTVDTEELLAVYNAWQAQKDFGRGEQVYVIRSGQRVKIGRSVDVGARLAALRKMMPQPCRVVATFSGGAAEELALHKRFAAYRQHGEWFDVKGELRGWIRGGCK